MKNYIKIRPKLPFKHAGYPNSTRLDLRKVYRARIAFNQPDYVERGKVFVDCPGGAPELMLEKDDYTVIK
jgi:hypothetical protein